MYIKDRVCLGDSLVGSTIETYIRVINTTELELELLIPMVQLQEILRITTKPEEIFFENHVLSIDPPMRPEMDFLTAGPEPG